MQRRVRPWLFVVLAAVALWGGWSTYRRLTRAARTVAWTTCPWFGGAPVVTMVNDIPPYDTLPTRAHEEVHAQQCRDFGPLKYRLKSLTSAGKVEVETPAFCAGALARFKEEPDSQYVSERLYTDMIEGMSDLLDSNTVKAALLKQCPLIASQPRRMRPRRASH